MLQEEHQAQDSELPSGPSRAVERNPFRNPEYLRGWALAAPSGATNPFLNVISTAVETEQAAGPAEGLKCDSAENVDNGRFELQVDSSVTKIETAGNIFMGTNYGQVTQTVEEYDVLPNLPIHPDISGHLGEYFPDSRSDDESHILRWIDSRDPPELVICVLGKAGVGKSTLAKHLATKLGKDKRLAANIFLGFALLDWSAELVVRMAAGQLCGAFPVLTRTVYEAIRRDVNPSASFETRIQSLILEPIRSLALPHPLVIILDALDQWTPHPILIKALACLTTETHRVRFVVLGRPGLEDRFQNFTFRRYDLLDVLGSVMANYFKERFNQVQWEYGRKPSVETINQLVNKASGLFIWSSTLCSVLEDELSCPNPHETITAILQSQQSVDDNDALANLYHSAIYVRFPKPDHRSKLKVLLGALLVLQEPLPISALASLVSMAAPTIRKILADLRPLQSGRAKDDQDMVFPASMKFHLSFLEYLQNADTPPHLAFPVDTFTSHTQIGRACLEELCRLSSLPQSNCTAPLQKYAMRYWPTHVTHGTPSVTPTSDVEWKATPHSAILDGLSFPQWQFWSSIYLQLVYPSTPLDLSEPAHESSDMTTHDCPQSLISRIVSSLLDAPAGTLDAIAVAEVGVRLQHQSADAWLQLGTSYTFTSQTNASASLLQCAVQACRYATNIEGKGGHRFTSTLLLAKCLVQRFTRFGCREDLEEAVSMQRAVMLATPLSHPDHALSLNNLAMSLHAHSKLIGAAGVPCEEIMLLREALSLWPSGHLNRAIALNNLANSLKSSQLKDGAKNLEEAIELLREALSIWPWGHWYRAVFLDNLANALHSQFTITGTVKCLEEALMLYREALVQRPSAHPDHALSLNNLGCCLQSHFQLTGSKESLNEAIILLREALSLSPPTHSRHAVALNNLANSLQSHFELTGTSVSFDEAIELLQEVLLLLPPGHSDRTFALSNLGNTYYSHFKIAGTAESLDKAVALLREALLLRPSGHPFRVISLNNLADSLRSQFRRTGSTENLDEAISFLEEALSLWPSGHPDRASSLNILATCLESKFKLTGASKTLDEAIVLYRQALLLRPSGHPDRALFLSNLARSLHCHFDAIGAAGTLDELINLFREALSLWSSDHPYRASSLNMLAIYLKSKFKLTGASKNLDEAIVLDRQALELRPSGHPDRAASLNNLADSLYYYFELTGATESLDEVLIHIREALSLWPSDHPDRTSSLNILASSLLAQSKLTGASETLDEAIVLYREALSLRPLGHPDRVISLHNLAFSLHSHFELTGTTEAVDEAIILLQEALSLWPSDVPSRSTPLNTLGLCFQSQFEATGSSVSLDNAIVLSREALLLQPSGHPHRVAPLINLAYNLRCQFDLTGNAETLDEAIMLFREAVSLCPSGHPHHVDFLANLALALEASHGLTGNVEVLEEANSLKVLVIEAMK